MRVMETRNYVVDAVEKRTDTGGYYAVEIVRKKGFLDVKQVRVRSCTPIRVNGMVATMCRVVNINIYYDDIDDDSGEVEITVSRTIGGRNEIEASILLPLIDSDSGPWVDLASAVRIGMVNENNLITAINMFLEEMSKYVSMWEKRFLQMK